MMFILRTGLLAVLLAAGIAMYAALRADRALAAPPEQDAATETASPTATFRPTSTPTPSPADLALASRFAQGGKFEEAVGAYLAVIERGPPAERLAARLALAKVYLNDGSNSLAAGQLEAYLLEAPASASVSEAQLMLAQALSRGGDDADALPLYRAYLQAGGRAVTYARLGQAESLAAVGRTQEAATEAAGVLSQDLPPPTRLTFILQMAQLLENSSPPDAVAWYDRLHNESSAPEDKALGMWRSALLSGDANTQSTVWVTVLQTYPETATAQEIVDSPPPVSAAGPLIDPYYRGLVYYYGHRNDEARQQFEQVLAVQDANAGNGAFYLGAIAERQSLANDAIEHYGRVPELDPGSSLADDALWWRSRLLEQAARPDVAASTYNQLIAGYGGSGFADEARFRLGLLAYDAGDTKAASGTFAEIAKTAGEEELRQRAQLWQGKALEAGDRGDEARSVWESLVADAPHAYYGLRAAVLLGDGDGRLRGGLEAQGEPDWSAIEAWLRETNAGDPLLARQSLFGNPHWNEGSVLLSAGLVRNARAEFEVVLEGASGNAALLAELARAYRAVGLIDLSARAAARLLALSPEDAAERAPPDLWRLAYPAPFAEALDDAAGAEDVLDILLLAMVRQESFFDPLAGSPAGAIGLAQVIPATGAEIANELELANFATSTLFRPSLSLRFGAHYLREQMDLFDGDMYAALAAYNAGPGSALRWLSRTDGDLDRLVAEIEYAQTERYVILVAENLARYRQLYQGLDRPALPRD